MRPRLWSRMRVFTVWPCAQQSADPPADPEQPPPRYRRRGSGQTLRVWTLRAPSAVGAGAGWVCPQPFPRRGWGWTAAAPQWTHRVQLSCTVCESGRLSGDSLKRGPAKPGLCSGCWGGAEPPRAAAAVLGGTEPALGPSTFLIWPPCWPFQVGPPSVGGGGDRVTDPTGHAPLLRALTGSGSAPKFTQDAMGADSGRGRAGQGRGSALGSRLQVLLLQARGSGWEGACAARPSLCTCGAPQRRPQTLPRQTDVQGRSHVRTRRPRGPDPPTGSCPRCKPV